MFTNSNEGKRYFNPKNEPISDSNHVRNTITAIKTAEKALKFYNSNSFNAQQFKTDIAGKLMNEADFNIYCTLDTLRANDLLLKDTVEKLYDLIDPETGCKVAEIRKEYVVFAIDVVNLRKKKDKLIAYMQERA